MYTQGNLPIECSGIAFSSRAGCAAAAPRAAKHALAPRRSGIFQAHCGCRGAWACWCFLQTTSVSSLFHQTTYAEMPPPLAIYIGQRNLVPSCSQALLEGSQRSQGGCSMLRGVLERPGPLSGSKRGWKGPKSVAIARSLIWGDIC